MRRALIIGAAIAWTLFIWAAQAFKGGNVGSLPRCAEPTCGDVWWHPWAALIVGFVVILGVAWITRRRPATRR